jgi:hypothetical protein
MQATMQDSLLLVAGPSERVRAAARNHCGRVRRGDALPGPCVAGLQQVVLRLPPCGGTACLDGRAGRK